ncbi:hypothetical protein FH972_023657 [Carpinus fangiana]|uniref:Pre-rRNA-processing protein RIX1 N-terminal domain-containing protein n=1 Tax=Carpinus fangiana TaxID=176857 RepID=A0A5N6KWB2_9ROSI|nr:hypothetical protein FH972_023657 [Carpinus fangiana]
MSKSNAPRDDPLRTVTSRLSATAGKQLPSVIPHITRSLIDCKATLSQAESQKSKGSPDAVSLHKFKTQVNALLNDKTPEGRYAAIVLVKTTIDLGGHEQLQKCGPWVRGLLSILGRPSDSPVSKRLAIITLTRIFLLTHDFQTLVRELTTPSLPSYITTCLNIVAPKTTPSKPAQVLAQRTLLEPVLESFTNLLPNHPNIFRTFLSQINALIAPLLAPTPSSPEIIITTTPSVAALAQNLFTLLPICAPKQSTSNSSNSNPSSSASTPASSEAWLTALDTTISSIQTTADLLFRAVHEEWRPIAGTPLQSHDPASYDAELGAADGVDLAPPHVSGSGLPGWSGVHAGGERLTGLLLLLQAFLRGRTAAAVTLPVARVVDVLTRVTSVVGPLGPASGGRGKKGKPYTMRVNTAISQDERVGLWTEMPAVHAAACDAITTLLLKLGSSILPVIDILFDQLVWVFEHGSTSEVVREAVYVALTEVLELVGMGFKKDQTRALDAAVRGACGDLLPVSSDVYKTSPDKNPNTNGASSTKKGQTSINADALFKFSTPQSYIDNFHNATSTGLQNAAHDFIVTYTAVVPAPHTSAATRAMLDRTAILGQDADVMLASVMNPPHNDNNASKSRSSILPHLARSFQERLQVEAFLRPRMPTLKIGHQNEDSPEDKGTSGSEGPEQDDLRGEDDEDQEMADASADPPEDVFSFTTPTAPNAPTGSGATEAPRPHDSKSLLGKRSTPDPDIQSGSGEKKARVNEPIAVEPVVVPGSHEPSENSHVAATQTSNNIPSSLNVNDSDDDDNFVMPTLTLEQDTDDEDESE